MGRIQEIEDFVAGSLPVWFNLKLIVRGRPQYLDPQLDGGMTRFSIKRGFNSTAVLPDNQCSLTADADVGTTSLTVDSVPSWMDVGCLVRVGQSGAVGETHTLADIIGTTGLALAEPLIDKYSMSDPNPYYVTLIGIPGSFFEVSVIPRKVLLVEEVSGIPRKVLLVESWYETVPGDSLLASATPQVLDSLVEFPIVSAKLLGTRPGDPIHNEPTTVYRYEIEIKTQTGLLPFTPTAHLRVYLKAYPLFYRGPYGNGDVKLPPTIGPCLIDVFSGGLLYSNPVETKMGLQTWDASGNQVNTALANGQPWQPVDKNYLILERPISADQMLFWQRIRGEYQYQQIGYFNAVLDDEGQFVTTTDTLVPAWPTDIKRGWVIPIRSVADVRVAVQFEPQAPQYFDIPANTVTFIRPNILAGGPPITRMMFSMLGSPKSTVTIQTWQFNGPTVESISYFMLGTGDAFGQNKWIAGGICAKPLFFTIDTLRGRYGDGVSKYNSGYIYS